MTIVQTNVQAAGLTITVPLPETLDPAAQLAAQASALEIGSKDELAQAVDWAAQLKAAHEEAEEARDFLVRPMNEHVKAINAVFKPKTDAIKGALVAIKRKIGTYHSEELAKEQAAARAAAEFIGASQEVQDIVGTVEQREVARTGSATAVTADRWNYEVVDLQALCAGIASGAVDVAFVEPAKGKIRVAMNALVKRGALTSEEHVIHGIRYFKETDVRLS